MMQKEIYILGAGAIGCLLAQAFASAKDAPVVNLILRNDNSVQEFESNRSEIRLTKRFLEQSPTSKVRVRCCTVGTIKVPVIENLIIATKVYQTVDVLKSLSKYLNADSSVIIVQNGMGVYDIVQAANIWPNEPEPKFYQGVTTHGVVRSSENKFHIYQNGSGYLVLASISCTNLKPPIVDILETSDGVSGFEKNELNISFLSKEEFRIKQFEKLVINACLNPLCAIINCVNGELLELNGIKQIFSSVIEEALSAFLLEMGDVIGQEDIKLTLNSDTLYETVTYICKANAKDSPSMRDDVLNLRETEVDFINGYIVRLAQKHSIPAVVNSTLVTLVKSKLIKGIKDSISTENCTSTVCHI